MPCSTTTPCGMCGRCVLVEVAAAASTLNATAIIDLALDKRAEWMREQIIATAQAYTHTLSGTDPAEADELDRIASYSNATVRNIVASAKALPLRPTEEKP